MHTLWDLTSGQIASAWKGNPRDDSPAALSLNGKRLASITPEPTVTVVDIGTGRELLTLREHTEPIVWSSFSPDGTRFATGSEDAAIKVWDASTGERLLTLTGPDSLGVGSSMEFNVAFSANGEQLVLRSSSSPNHQPTASVWDIASGRQNVLKGHFDGWGVALSADGMRLAAGSDTGMVKVLDVVSGQLLLTLKGHVGRSRCVAFSPDGKRIASGGEDGTVRVWDAILGEQTLTLDGHNSEVTSVTFSADGNQLRSADFLTTRIWDVTMAEEVPSARNRHTPVDISY